VWLEKGIIRTSVLEGLTDEQTTPPVCPEGFGQARIDEKRKPRGFRLRVTDSALDNTSLHQHVRSFQLKSPHLPGAPASSICGAHSGAHLLLQIRTRVLNEYGRAPFGDGLSAID